MVHFVQFEAPCHCRRRLLEGLELEELGILAEGHKFVLLSNLQVVLDVDVEPFLAFFGDIGANNHSKVRRLDWVQLLLGKLQVDGRA